MTPGTDDPDVVVRRAYALRRGVRRRWMLVALLIALPIAAAVATHLAGLTGRKVALALRGGTLTIEWDESSGHVLLTGPAREVFQGTWTPGPAAS